MTLLQALPPLEVLIFNLLTINHCSTRKYSVRRTIAVLAVFSAVLLCFCMIFAEEISFQGNGNLSLFGMIYLLPLKYLYKEKPLLLVVIVCTSWTYTLGILSLSIQIADAAGGGVLFLLAVETVLFLASVFPFYRWLVSKYVFILKNLESFGERWYKYMALSSCLYFLVLVALNNVFLKETGTPLKVFSLTILLATICVFYFILYEIVLNSLRLNKLEHAALHDPLTGLGNRAKLWDRLRELLQKEETFAVLFMDLDKFKSVNDNYGHIVGDQYLKRFASICSDILRDWGEVYRFGGDEFVAVCRGDVSEEMLTRIRECREWEPGGPCPFYSVSAGVLRCCPPHNGVEQILQQVDRLMYENKIKKHAGTAGGNPQSRT